MTYNRLWITEKPDAARNLVAGICRAYGATSQKRGGYIELSNGDCVLPLQGHMLEMSPPAAYAREGQDHYELLPLLPPIGQFKIEPRKESQGPKSKTTKVAQGAKSAGAPHRQFVLAKQLLGQCREIVNAGDVDREGQLIVDELLTYLGVDPTGRKVPVWRLPLVSAREDDIAGQIAAGLQRNGDEKWVRKRLAAQCRSESDFLLGMNGSIAFQKSSGIRSLSVGRVQSTVLRLVVERDAQVENFRPRDYFVPVVILRDGTEMRWSKRDGAQGAPGFDEAGRIVDEAVARQIVSAISSGLQGRVTVADKDHLKEAPPLPFSAGTLQVAGGKRLGMTVKEVTSVAEQLYLKHKAISYVGTDCQYLPESMLEDAKRITDAIARFYPKEVSGSNLDLRSKAWNDAKVDEHYAIIPTGTLPDGATPQERAVYDLVVRRYVAQFYPAHEYLRHSLAAVFGKDEFRASKKEVLRQGWRVVEGAVEADEAEGESPEEREGQSQASRHGQGRA
jgi:DNA topoisomerase-3